MNRKEDTIELYDSFTGSGERDEPSSSTTNVGRSGSFSFMTRKRKSVSRDDCRPFVPLSEDDAVSLEDHAAEIVRRMEQDEALMEDNPVSEHLRMETLRDMPQCLTLKRSIKARLTKSVSKKSKHRPLGFFKRCKYQISISFVKLQTTLKNVVYSLELWYSSLKAIEGHFGSSVATYFKFLRWIFIMNFLVMIPIVIFLFIPQIIHRFYGRPENGVVPSSLIDENNQTILPDKVDAGEMWNNFVINPYPYRQNAPFSFVNLITGEGFLTWTTLYYGFYTNNSISIIPYTSYNMPHAYFFTMLFIYSATFIVLSISMAKSYRKSFIETSGGLKNIYAHKVFCGWDYSIATKEGAALKSSAIYNELKELLSDSDIKSRQMPFLSRFWTRGIQIVVHLFIFLLLIGIGYLMWLLLDKHRGNLETDKNSDLKSASVVTAFVITIIMTLGPLFFTWIIRIEDYKSPRTLVYISLMRTFLLEIVVIGVLITFWLNKATKSQCWETSLGQEVYRLILIDFIFSVLFTTFIEFVRHLVYTYVWKKIGVPEFDIARHTLQIIYNQTLFWVGLYFSPLLACAVTVKCWFTWYLKRLSCLKCCRPSARSWRAAQTQTVFLVMTFLALFAVVIVFGYIMTQVPTSDCGPFRNYTYMYQMILEGVFQVQQGHTIVKFIMYLTKPGVITFLLIAMSVRVYYLRSKCNAQRDMVELLREMLLIEAKDKEFLLTNISKVTQGTWIYNLNKNDDAGMDINTEASDTWQFRSEPYKRSSKQKNQYNSWTGKKSDTTSVDVSE